MGDDFFSIGLSFLLTAAGFSKTAHMFSFIAFILTNFEEKQANIPFIGQHFLFFLSKGAVLLESSGMFG